MSDFTINKMEPSSTGFEATIALTPKTEEGILRKENYGLILCMNTDTLKPAICKEQCITIK